MLHSARAGQSHVRYLPGPEDAEQRPSMQTSDVGLPTRASLRRAEIGLIPAALSRSTGKLSGRALLAEGRGQDFNHGHDLHEMLAG